MGARCKAAGEDPNAYDWGRLIQFNDLMTKIRVQGLQDNQAGKSPTQKKQSKTGKHVQKGAGRNRKHQKVNKQVR